jgi:hypothetical protein
LNQISLFDEKPTQTIELDSGAADDSNDYDFRLNVEEKNDCDIEIHHTTILKAPKGSFYMMEHIPGDLE